MVANSKTTDFERTVDTDDFVVKNAAVFSELLTFIDFAEGLTIGFLEVNQQQNQTALVDALRAALAETDTQLEIFNFSREHDLRFLKDALVERLRQRGLEPKAPPGTASQRRVLLLRGLEAAIGTSGTGAYPPILQDLNFVRDAYQQDVPYPLLFLLPDYAITRVSKYAPDFWDWNSGVFRFQSTAQNVEAFKTEVFE